MRFKWRRKSSEIPRCKLNIFKIKYCCSEAILKKSEHLCHNPMIQCVCVAPALYLNCTQQEMFPVTSDLRSSSCRPAKVHAGALGSAAPLPPPPPARRPVGPPHVSVPSGPHRAELHGGPEWDPRGSRYGTRGERGGESRGAAARGDGGQGGQGGHLVSQCQRGVLQPGPGVQPRPDVSLSFGSQVQVDRFNFCTTELGVLQTRRSFDTQILPDDTRAAAAATKLRMQNVFID